MIRYNLIIFAALVLTLQIRDKALQSFTNEGQFTSRNNKNVSFLQGPDTASRTSYAGFQSPNMEITLCGGLPKTKSATTMNITLEQKGEKSGMLNTAERNIREKGFRQDKETTILIEIVPELMKFHIDTFTVTAGSKINLELDNLDGMQHNLLITKPGTLEKVGNAADAMVRDPKASDKHYVPDMPEVLFATEMLGPYEVYTLTFTAPSEPGDYPFVCTFPGHWRMMNGIMRVEKS